MSLFCLEKWRYGVDVGQSEHTCFNNGL